MKLSIAVASALASAATVSAHTTFQYFQNAGNDYGSSYIRIPPNNNPVENVDSAVMGCNVGGSVGKPNKATVAAGSVVTVEFHHEGRATQGVDPSHKGPTIAYLAKVNDATTASDAGLGWFKIFQDGYTPGAALPWAVDKFNANGGKWSFTIPTAIPNGDYLLRPETIALHGAGNYPGAQLYFGCAQITVTGGTGGSPATVSFPGAYKGTDPGIKVSIYYPPLTNYIVPGPPVYTGGSTPQSSTVVPPASSSTRASSTTPVSSSTRTSSTAAPSTSSGTGTGAPLYGQCGGIGWTGPTTCASGTCKKSNDYYSQCLP